MGWTFTYGQKRAELISERSETREWDQKDGTHVKDVVLAHCYRGGVFSGVWYAVHERTRSKDAKVTDSERWIEVTLMQCHRYPDHGPSWGYKDMEESMGPCEVSCPLGYLDMVPERTCPPDCKGCAKDSCSGLWARKWRKNVREYHAKRAASRNKVKALKPNDIVRLKEGCSPKELVIVSVRPLVGEFGGRRYKFKANQLA